MDGPLTPEGYLRRVVDREVEAALGSSPAVVIEGPRACGKTWTARRFAASAAALDESDDARLAAALDPGALLGGDAPRLLDEWQLAPRIWNPMRHACDRSGRPGRFILTGSANPPDDATRHSGAGRVTRVRMRPMSLFESGESTGAVSLGGLLNGERAAPSRSDMTLAEVVDLVCRGGWPWLLDAPVPDAQSRLRDYLGEIARTEIPRSGGPAHDPVGVGRLLVSLARNEATNVTYRTLADDVSGGTDASTHPRTVRRYLEALSRLFVVEGLPAWAPHLRSASQLRRTEKRYFVDPSLAVAALRTNAGRLRADLGFLGLLFESLAMRDLRVYAQANDARVFYFRDNATLEVDAIVERADGEWMAAEIKLGGEALIRHGVKSLLRLRDRVDAARMGTPAALLVITATGYGFQHPDGVAIMPLGALGP
ncbi:MAG: DUF4143 domain-containing protein [bacterium]|nr:DUF4143 domain-containing protein [bacterium]MCY4104075.1 DUF4143 domain-containing protein [bacterium]